MARNRRPYREVRFTGDADSVNEQWLGFRRHGVGGSDVAPIMGVSPFRSPLEVWLEKTGRVEPDDISDRPAVYWGTILEDVVALEFARQHPEMKVKKSNVVYQSVERPWAIASIDRALTCKGKRGILEIKTASAYKSHEWEDGIPLYYQTQVLHYLSVTGWDFAWVAVLIGGNTYKEFKVEVDEADMLAVTKAVDEFWTDFVEADIMPEIVGMDSEIDALNAYYAESDGDMLLIDDEDIPYADAHGCDIADAYKEVMDSMRDLDRFKKKYKAQLLALIQDHDGFATDTRVVKHSRGRITIKEVI